MTFFVGRSKELTSSLDMLVRERCFQVCGPPGVGKSTLLRQVLDHLDESWAHRWFVDLTVCSSFDEMIVEIARAVGVVPKMQQEQWTEFVLSQLDYVFEHALKMCIVFDNAEHLLPELRPLLERWLAFSTVHCVVGSRVHEASLVTLELSPWMIESSDVNQMKRHPGVQLFIARASEKGRHFKQDDEVETIYQLVDHVQGLPLAIELLASRVGFWHPSQLLKQTQRQDLSGGVQQQLLRTVSWSWSLLGEDEQLVLSQCAVSQDAIDVEAISRQLERDDVASMLEQLKQYGLLIEAGGGYQMLFFIRQFVAQFITEPHRERYVRYWAWRCDEAFNTIRGNMWDPMAKALNATYSELAYAYHLACAWLHSPEPPEDIVVLLCQLSTGLFGVISHVGDMALYRQLLDREPDLMAQCDVPRVRHNLRLASLSGRVIEYNVTDGFEQLFDLLDDVRANGDTETECWVCAALALSLAEGGEAFAARHLEVIEYGLALATSIGEDVAHLRLLIGACSYYTYQRDIELASRYAKQAIASAQRLGRRGDESRSWHSLGVAYRLIALTMRSCSR